ncbi:MAG TPA: hypothetical protein VNJ03_03445 [Vicinamibacterales bacterium]|nr:hypothetical protein [Vicinamibacterales bacterium]
MPFILALEPDQRQAALLRHVITTDVHAEMIIVESRDAAVAAISTRVPDVILLTALLSPRDEDDLISHLRTRDGVEHVQTHTIPMLASAAPDEPVAGGGLLGRLRRKKETTQMVGCDPAMFAEEVRSYLARAAELKAETQAVTPAQSDASPIDVEAAELERQTREMRERQRAELEERQRAEHEEHQFRQRLEAAQAAERDRERREREEQRILEAEEAAERERQLLDAEAAAQRAHLAERLRFDEERKAHEAEEAAERERLMRAADAAAELARADERRRFDEERQRREMSEAAERERLMREAAAAAERERQADRDRREEERRRIEAEEAGVRDRLMREAAAVAERTLEAERARMDDERRVLEAAQVAERERLTREAEAAAGRAMEAERQREAEEMRRRAAQEAAEHERQLRTSGDAAAAERRARREKQRKAQPAVVAARREVSALTSTPPAAKTPKTAQPREAPRTSSDPFADFRAVVTGTGVDSIFKNMPIAAWARTSRPAAAPPSEPDDAVALLARLGLPVYVSGFAYPRGCRIRRVRVPACAEAPAASSGPVILSKRALEEIRTSR